MNLKIQEAVGERKAQLDLTLAWCISRTGDVLSRFKPREGGLAPGPAWIADSSKERGRAHPTLNLLSSSLGRNWVEQPVRRCANWAC